MEEITHFSHHHALILSDCQNPPAHSRCSGCHDPIIKNTHVYQCNTKEDSSCAHYFLHKTCSTLPPYIQHDLHVQHMLTLGSGGYVRCHSCAKRMGEQFAYVCISCFFFICLKCSSPERDLNHASHNHTLTLLPMKSSHFCGACFTKGSEDFSYLCKTCLFLVHKRCASAPPELIFKAHHDDHPLVLDYSVPGEYQRFGVFCNLCREKVLPSRWLYYCADCRYFAHFNCVLTAIESGEDRNIYEDVEDVDDPNLVCFPLTDNKPFLLYQLIQKFAENFSSSTNGRSGKADKISHCGNGHSLILFDNFYNKIVGETGSSDHMICDGCVQPILSPPDSFYGCLDCNFFLHNICAAELPREFEHASHPEHKLIRCDQIGKPNALFRCSFCGMKCNGMFYHCETCEIYIDLVCAAMPISEIKHDTHKHKLKYANDSELMRCEECWDFNNSMFRCKICNYVIDASCLRKPGRIKHRWDEHQLCLVYPPVKGHPHDFNCEQCSEDINPNYWFYHCRECDTSFHAGCLDQCEFSNIKFGAIVKDDQLHQHSLKISPRAPFKCGSCGYNIVDRWQFRFSLPTLTCVSCKFLVCGYCTLRNGGQQKKHQ